MAPSFRRPPRALPWTLVTLGCAAHAPNSPVAPIAATETPAPVEAPVLIVAAPAPVQVPIEAVSQAPTSAARPPSPVPAPPRIAVTALSMAVNVVQNADSRSVVLGYLRRGASVEATRGPLSGRGCAHGDDDTDGWYELATGGYVCVGGGSVARAEDVTPGQRHRFPVPPRDAALPYTYALALGSVVMYRQLPTLDDERTAEPERFAPAPPPALAPQEADARATPHHHHTLAELNGEEGTPVLRRLTRGMHVALDRQMRSENRARWWRTQSGGYVRAGILDTLGNRTWEGAHFDAQTRLPVAFVSSSEAWVYRRSDDGLEPESRAPRLAVYSLTDDAPITWRDERWYATTDGHYLRARNIRTATTRTPPEGLSDGERWIDVHLGQQTLVAYEGTQAVFATLVSTGVPAPGHLTHETVRGDFRIEAKHWTTTMDGDTVGGGAYSIEEVPWVMYFHGSYALHAAFWHSSFGYVHSHGCVNLSPPDARWLFRWTSPALPEGWHGVKATRDQPGTRVLVHGDDV